MPWQFPDNCDPSGFASMAREFLLWAEADLNFSQETMAKYSECLKQVWLLWGEQALGCYTDQDILKLKLHFKKKELSASRQTTILLALKRYLLFCQAQKGINLQVKADEIKPPRRPRRQVVYLTNDEIARFLGSIPLSTYNGEAHLAGLRLRALVEVLLGSAMRIGEVLSLNRDSVNFQVREATVIGKGSKQRTVFFTERALEWVQRYLDLRTDDCPALFASLNGRCRLKRDDLWRYFDRHRRLADIKKPVTPHILRHTAATRLLFNGCPVGHIKEILGHERLETTCRYYLGLDQRAAKSAHARFLFYEDPGSGISDGVQS